MHNLLASNYYRGSGGGGSGQVTKPPENANFGKGCLEFLSDNNGYLQYLANNDWDFGTGDFTVEMFAWLCSEQPHMAPRLFSLNVYPSDLALSLESTSDLYFFADNGQVVFGVNYTSYLNTWTHIAVVRFEDVITIYLNGQAVGTMPHTGTAGNSSDRLKIGTEDLNVNPINGYITDFHIVKGEALYTGNFTPDFAVATPNSKLLLTVPDWSQYSADSSTPPKYPNSDNSSYYNGTPVL